MENKNATMVREWKDDPDCFIRMLNSPSQCRKRNDRRQKDAERDRLINALYAGGLFAFVFVMTLFVVCTIH